MDREKPDLVDDSAQLQNGNKDKEDIFSSENLILTEATLEILLSIYPRLNDLIFSASRFAGFLSEPEPDIDIEEIPEEIKYFFRINKIPLENAPRTSLLSGLNLIINVGKKVSEQKRTMGSDTAIKAVIERLADVFESILGRGERPTQYGAKRLAEAAVVLALNYENSSKGNGESKNSYDIVHETENAFIREMENYVYNSFKDGKLDYRSLYARPDIWIAVEQSPDYIALEKGREILKASLKEIAEICAPDTKNIRAIDLGMGAGEKGKLIDSIFILSGKEVDYRGVDSSPIMLKSGIIMMALDFAEFLIKEKDEYKKLKEKGDEEKLKEFKKCPWFALVEFIEKNDLKLSTNSLLRDVLYRIFYRHLNPEWRKKEEQKKGKEPDLFKYLITRIFALHKKRSSNLEMITELDETINIPLKLNPYANSIEELDKALFIPSEDQAVVAFDLGCRSANQHPQESIDLYKKLLIDPKIENGKITAPHLVVGLQISHFDQTDKKKFESEKEKITSGYNSPESLDFVTYPFKFDFCEYFDPHTNKLLGFNDLLKYGYAEIKTAYEEDPKNAGYFRIIHKLVFNKNLNVNVAKMDPVIKKPDDEIILIASYKPTLKQLIELYTDNGLMICKIYKDNDECPKYIKLLVRKMTQDELSRKDEITKELLTEHCGKDFNKPSATVWTDDGSNGKILDTEVL